MMKERISELLADLNILVSSSEEDFANKHYVAYEQYLKEYNSILLNLQKLGLFSDLNQIQQVHQSARGSLGRIGTSTEVAKHREIITESKKLVHRVQTYIGPEPRKIDIEIMDRQKIEINNPVFNKSNVQIGDKNKQEISTLLNKNKDSRIKPEKPGIFKLITDPSTLAALGGFFSVEIGTYFYPVSYNHLIGVIIATVILIIGIFIKYQKTKNV